MKTLGNEIRRMTVPFEIKEIKEETGQYAGTFEGYAAGIHNIDRVGDMILPGAFVEDLPRFLGEGVVCWQHDWMSPIGVPTEAREDEYGLFSKCRVSNTTQGKDAMTLIKDGVVKKLSIGYRVQNYEWVDRAGLITYLGISGLSEARKDTILRQYDEMELDELFLLKKIRLYEFSPVSVPANPNAIITGAKGLLAGLSFGDQLLTALAAVREVKERASQIKTLRESEGRALSRARKDRLSELACECLDISDEIHRVLDEQEMAERLDAAKLFAEFQQIEARALGCAV